MVEDTGEQEVVETEETPQEEDALQKKVDELIIERDNALKEREKATESMKGHQRIAEERKIRLGKAEANQTKIDRMEKRIDVLIRMQADQLDRGDDDVEPVKRRRSEVYLNELRDEPKASVSQDAPEVLEALSLAESAGLDFDNSLELANAYRLMAQGKHTEGLIATKVAIGDKTKTVEDKKEEPKVLSEEEEEEIARKVFERKGGNKNSITKPAGGSMTRAQAYEAAAKGELSFEKQQELGLI